MATQTNLDIVPQHEFPDDSDVWKLKLRKLDRDSTQWEELFVAGEGSPRSSQNRVEEQETKLTPNLWISVAEATYPVLELADVYVHR